MMNMTAIDKIYKWASQSLLEKSYELFNVEGAIKVGMHAFQFIDHDSCEKKLMTLLSSKHE